MGRTTRANDWQFAGILSLGASIGIACGGWVFTFKSLQAAHQEDFVMLGLGIGTPGTTVEVSLPGFMEGDLSWSPIHSQKAFSAEELNGAMGTIGTAGVSAGIGYSRLYASGNEWTKPAGIPAPKEYGKSIRPPGPLFPETKSPFFEQSVSSFLKMPENPAAGLYTTPVQTGPLQTVPPRKPVPPQPTRYYFRDQLNDGYGVLADIEAQKAAQDIGDGLLEAAGKSGRRFKPAVSIGVMGVAGVWFSIGSVVTQSMAAVGYVAVSIVSGGLVQAGEALLTGRGMNVMNSFASGYAKQLANLTSEKPVMPNDVYGRLKYLDWKSDLATYGQKHVDGGTRAPVSSFPEIGTAGEAAILQAVHRFVDANGEEAWYAVCTKHLQTLGTSNTHRQNTYEQALWRQVAQRKPVGFLPSASFLP